MTEATLQRSIILPWPKTSKLSQNGRGGWRAQHGRRKRYKDAVKDECQAQRIKRMATDAVDVTITFCPPDNRKRNDDNIIASFKGGRDGVAEMIGVPDENWCVTYEFGDVVSGGEVRLVVTRRMA